MLEKMRESWNKLEKVLKAPEGPLGACGSLWEVCGSLWEPRQKVLKNLRKNGKQVENRWNKIGKCGEKWKAAEMLKSCCGDQLP